MELVASKYLPRAVYSIELKLGLPQF